MISAMDNAALYLHEWPCAHAARGAVLIVHGLGEHGGRYAHVAADLNARGWHALAYDHAGHGRSCGARGAIATPDALLRDLGAMIDVTRERAAGGRVVLLGHSLGGLIAARFVAEALDAAPATWSRPVDALALSSPALDPALSAFQKFLLAVLGPIAPNLALGNGVDPDGVSRDPAVVRAYRSDPLVHDRITARLARFIVDAAVLVLERAPRWRLPTLLMFAGRDRLVSARGSRAFAAAAPASCVRVREFPELYHEILNEPEQGAVLEALGDWLAAQ